VDECKPLPPGADEVRIPRKVAKPRPCRAGDGLAGLTAPPPHRIVDSASGEHAIVSTLSTSPVLRAAMGAR
jgi:hypothetical protein